MHKGSGTRCRSQAEASCLPRHHALSHTKGHAPLGLGATLTVAALLAVARV